ncbi:MAG: hypothetical protein QME46_05325 [Thermoanaerobacteraceae bacterium]|nr:hypothetical protein [Thermoanaerobacteraceae bacterium]
MSNRLSIEFSDESYKKLVECSDVYGNDLFYTIGVAINLLHWANQQKKEGFEIYSKKSQNGKDIIRKITF